MKKIVLLLAVVILSFASSAFGASSVSCIAVKDSKQKILESFRSSVSRLGGIVTSENNNSVSANIGKIGVGASLFDHKEGVEMVISASHQYYAFKEQAQIKKILEGMSDIDGNCGPYKDSRQ